MQGKLREVIAAGISPRRALYALGHYNGAPTHVLDFLPTHDMVFAFFGGFCAKTHLKKMLCLFRRLFTMCFVLAYSTPF